MKFHILFILIALTSCVTGKGWESTDLPNSSMASYREFSGKKTLKTFLYAGESLNLKYILENTHGNLSIKVTSHVKGILLDKTIEGKVEDSLNIRSTGKKDNITILLTGKKAAGRYHLHYQKN